MGQKDFQRWHKKKSVIQTNFPRVFFHEREIWWCALGVNVGFEQDGKGDHFARPVLIFRKFNNELFWGIPLSTKIKDGVYYYQFCANDQILRVAILSRMRPMDAKRLIDKIGVANASDFHCIQKAVIALCV